MKKQARPSPTDARETTVFLSYSSKDQLFAELASIKLGEADITLWRDRGQLRPGADWRQGIEQGVAKSLAVVVALSSRSAESSYVTYEWAYALGKGKSIIPVKLEECVIHPKLETIQYLDFSRGSLPWDSLVERIREIESDDDDGDAANDPSNPEDPTVKAILAYLNQRGYQMVSFDRIRRRVDPDLTDNALVTLIDRNPSIFRRVMVEGSRPGLRKLVP